MITRLSIDQAAERLGVSRPTIRRRLRNGELRGERKPTKQGFVWEVLIDSPDGESPGTERRPPGRVAGGAPLVAKAVVERSGETGYGSSGRGGRCPPVAPPRERRRSR